MFEWSKEIMKKIEDSNCLEEKELAGVEIALRMYDMYEQALDENLGLEEKEILNLKHKLG